MSVPEHTLQDGLYTIEHLFTSYTHIRKCTLFVDANYCPRFVHV